MRYLYVLVLSAMMLLALIRPVIDTNFWHKLIYNKEDPPEKRKKEFRIAIVIWAVLTVVLFTLVALFGRD